MHPTIKLEHAIYAALCIVRSHVQELGTGTGLTSQISSAYCLMVRSELKKPEPAVYKMERLVHSSWSRYTLSTSSCKQEMLQINLCHGTWWQDACSYFELPHACNPADSPRQCSFPTETTRDKVSFTQRSHRHHHRGR